ncbi:inward rectifier potassium channel [Necator americanus]|uniref:Inward rectifier potassium channel n=1 Tax=Necator americanus TaxID=51031 RepID=W2TA14_NECAM|nr:inward rectifier potassium channel [Necator americanus]ETN78698.1 inward rectifier potassium channel [Necator americanus]
MKKSRLVGKNGICNVYNTNVPKKDRQYLRDIFTTMIDVKWRYMLFIFALVFVLRYITTECPLAGLTVCLQAVCGLLIQSFMVGLVFAKMARPKKRAETIIFSNNRDALEYMAFNIR